MTYGILTLTTLSADSSALQSIEEIEVLPHAAKKTDVMGGVTPAQHCLAVSRKADREADIGYISIRHSAVANAVQELKALLVFARNGTESPAHS